MDLLQFQLNILLLFIMPLLFIKPLLSNKLQLFPIRLSLHNMSHLLAFME